MIAKCIHLRVSNCVIAKCIHLRVSNWVIAKCIHLRVSNCVIAKCIHLRVSNWVIAKCIHLRVSNWVIAKCIHLRVSNWVTSDRCDQDAYVQAVTNGSQCILTCHFTTHLSPQGFEDDAGYEMKHEVMSCAVIWIKVRERLRKVINLTLSTSIRVIQ